MRNDIFSIGKIDFGTIVLEIRIDINYNHVSSEQQIKMHKSVEQSLSSLFQLTKQTCCNDSYVLQLVFDYLLADPIIPVIILFKLVDLSISKIIYNVFETFLSLLEKILLN